MGQLIEGKTKSVQQSKVATELVAASTAAASITVADPTIFREPESAGSLVQARLVSDDGATSELVRIRSIADATGIIGLDAAPTLAWAAATTVETYPLVYETDADVEIIEGSIVKARVPQHVRGRLWLGHRTALNAERVYLDHDGAEFVVVEVVSEDFAITNAADGKRYRLDNSGLKVWDAAGNLLIDLNAETLSHLLVGSIKNALTGTRIEIVSGVANFLFGYLSGFSEHGYVAFQDAGSGEAMLSLRAPGGPASDLPTLNLISGVGAGRMVFAARELDLAAGFQARGQCGVAANVGAAGQRRGHGVTYGGVTRTINVPNGVTFTPVGTDANVAAFDAIDITNRGFLCRAEALASGEIKASRTYVTTGA